MILKNRNETHTFYIENKPPDDKSFACKRDITLINLLKTFASVSECESLFQARLITYKLKGDTSG